MSRFSSMNAPRQVAFYVAFGLLAVTTVRAQDQDTPPERRPIPTMVGQLLDHDFVNIYAFANGIYDSYIPILSSSGQAAGNGALGYQVGGGVTAVHQFAHGDISLSYHGDYRQYTSGSYSGGNTQSLNLLFNRQLSRHWSISVPLSAGIAVYGSGGYFFSSAASSAVAPNPFSPETRYVQSGVNLTYQQTRRLSYVFGGSYFFNSYSYSGSIGSTGVSGSISALYRLTGKTTVGATYSHSYYHFSRGVGTSSVDGESLSITHDFPNHWQGSLSAGVNRSYSQGVLSLPISILLGQQTVVGYLTGPYERTTYTPSFQGTLTRFFRHSSASFSAGQGVMPGNGTYLTSRDQFASGLYSWSARRSNLSFAGNYFHLTSIANSVSQGFQSEGFRVTYGYTLRKYLAANFGYSYTHYGTLFALSSINDNTITFGLSLSTKSLPMGIF